MWVHIERLGLLGALTAVIAAALFAMLKKYPAKTRKARLSLGLHGAAALLCALAVCGFSVGILWPGTISISSKRIPLCGTAMFALLAMAGDLGGAIGPALVGWVSQAGGDDLRAGLRAGCVFPVVLIVSLVLLGKMSGKQPGPAKQ